MNCTNDRAFREHRSRIQITLAQQSGRLFTLNKKVFTCAPEGAKDTPPILALWPDRKLLDRALNYSEETHGTLEHPNLAEIKVASTSDSDSNVGFL